MPRFIFAKERSRPSLFYCLCAALIIFASLLQGSAEGELLPIRFNASGIIEVLAPDAAEAGSRSFEPGTPLICRWKTPDVDSVQWTLKDRGIIYTRAYRRCWSVGVEEPLRNIVYAQDGRYIIADTGNSGLRLTGPRGESRPVPSPSQYNDGLREEFRKAFSLGGKPGFFVLYTYHQDSILSSLLDRWYSEIFWFPDPENLEIRELIFSRASDRVHGISTLSDNELRLMEALRGVKIIAEEPESRGFGLLSGAASEDSDRQMLLHNWPWLAYADRIREIFFDRKAASDKATAEAHRVEPALFLLLNSKRFAKLVPGRDEVFIFPERAPGVFQEKILDFRVLNDHTLLVLLPTGLYLYDLVSGIPSLRADFPPSTVKRVYPALALTPDHRHAGIMLWTRAHRNEIYTVALQGPRSMKKVVGGEMDLRYVPGIDRAARFNPNAFNFSPDGLALVTLWNVKDGQEVRIYRLYDGDLAPLPPEIEDAEESSETQSEPLPNPESE